MKSISSCRQTYLYRFFHPVFTFFFPNWTAQEHLGLFMEWIHPPLLKHMDSERKGKVGGVESIYSVFVIKKQTNKQIIKHKDFKLFVHHTYISKLDQTQLSELTDAVIFRAGLQEQLRQAHLLTPKHHLYLPDRSPPLLNNPSAAPLNLHQQPFTINENIGHHRMLRARAWL